MRQRSFSYRMLRLGGVGASRRSWRNTGDWESVSYVRRLRKKADRALPLARVPVRTIPSNQADAAVGTAWAAQRVMPASTASIPRQQHVDAFLRAAWRAAAHAAGTRRMPPQLLLPQSRGAPTTVLGPFTLPTRRRPAVPDNSDAPGHTHVERTRRKQGTRGVCPWPSKLLEVPGPTLSQLHHNL